MPRGIPGSGAHDAQRAFSGGFGSKYLPNPEFNELMERTQTMANAMGVFAEEGADRAKEAAPVLSGDYKESIKGEGGFNEEGKAVGRVWSDDFKAGWIEFGTLYLPARAVLRRAVESVGLKTRSGR